MTEEIDVSNEPPVHPLPTQRLIDRIDEIQADLLAMSVALGESLDEQLEFLRGDLTLKLHELAGARGADASRASNRLSARELLPWVASAAAGSAIWTTVVALLLQP